MYGISGKHFSWPRFRPFDYKSGVFTRRLCFATLWNDKEYVQSLVEYMNRGNWAYTFKVVYRGADNET